MRINSIYLSFFLCLLFFGCGKDTPQPDKPIQPDPTLTKVVTSIKVDDKELVMKPGQKITLSYTVLPADAANKDVEITSSDAGVVAVSGKELTAVAIGKAVITLTNKASSVSTKIQVEVIPTDASELKLNKTEVTLVVGEKETLEATIIPEDAGEKELIWKSSDPKIATISSSGEIEAIAAGETEITVTTKDGKVSAKAKVLVTEKTVAVESIVLKPTDIALTVEASTTITATVLPANATDKALEWTSSAPTIVSVDSKGVAKALKAGSAVITASTADGKVSAKANVTVSEKVIPVESIVLKPTDITMSVLSSTAISATLLPANATNKTLEWKSSAPSIVSVDSKGVAKALKVGSATITASTKDGKVSAKTSVVVNPVLAESIVLDPANPVLAIGSTATISARVLPASTTDKSLVWASNAPSIVSVDSKGVVKALKAGTAVITATAKDGKVQSSVNVQVTEDISRVTGKLTFSLVSNQVVTIGMHVYMGNTSNKEITIKKVEAYADGALAATALTDFTQTINAQADDQWVIGFTQTRFTSVVGNYPPNWHAKVYFVINGVNYAMTIKNTGSSIQQLQQSSIGINPEWDGENTTEIPSK